MRQDSPPRRIPRQHACFAIATLALVGCGRKATEADCDLIVDRYVEVELRDLKVTDQKIIEQRKAEMRRDLRDELKTCPGKHITDSMMTCVRQAESNAALDKCTRW